MMNLIALSSRSRRLFTSGRSIRPLIPKDAAFVRKTITPSNLSPASLAFVGDAVYDLAVRERSIFPPIKWQSVPKKQRTINVSHLCRAETQDEILNRIMTSFHLTEEEMEYVNRGKNLAGKPPRNLKDKSLYRSATALEVLVGYLHFKDQKRLDMLFDFVFLQFKHMDFRLLQSRTKKT